MKTITQKSQKRILIIVILLTSMIGYSQTTQTYTSNTSFIVPAGVTTVQVEAWGGGGAGGGVDGANSSTRAGGGGSGGTYTKNTSVTVTPGASISVIIGAGGIGADAVDGPSGGTSTFAAAIPVTAAGGAGGKRGTANPNTNGAGGGVSTGSTFNGGSGAAASSGISGGGGGGAGSGADGGNASGITAGLGGSGTVAGGAGALGRLTNGDGINATLLSGGGGGGRSSSNTDRSGGDGYRGQIKLTYTCPTYALTSAATASGPFCGPTAATVTFRSASMPTGTYVITYNLTGSTGSLGNTATVSFTAGTPGTGTFTTAALNPGTTTITITNIASATCSNAVSTNNSVSVLTVVAPTSVAGTAVTTCSTAGAVNITAGSSASNYVLATWSSSGTGTVTNQYSLTSCTYTPSTADITAGSVTLTLTVNGTSPCDDVISTKTLTIVKAPTAAAGSAMAVCYSSGAIAITAGSSATNYTSVTWTSSGTGTFANAGSLTTATYTPSTADRTAGSVTLTLAAINPGCSNAVSTKTLTISSAATAVSGTAITACSTASNINITTGSSATNYTTVTWSSNGTGTFANPNSLTTATYTPSAADILAGSVNITLTATAVAPCSNAVSTKTLTLNAPPTAVAGSAMALCTTGGAINITAGSSASNYTTSAWTSSGTGSFSNATSLTTCTYTPSNADFTAGSVTLTLTVNSASCGSITDTKTLTIKRPATAVAGTNMSTCSITGAVNITAGSSATNNTGVIWTSNGTGTFANANSLTTATYTPSAADITAGSVIITLTATTSAPCSDAVATKTLTINTPPVANAGTAVGMCSTATSVNITAGSSATNYTSILWTSSGTGTFANANSLTTATYTPSAADKTAGSVTIMLTATNAGCGNDISSKTLTIYATPTITGTTPGTRTGAGTVILGATASAGTLYWYAASTGGTALGFGSTFTTPSISVTTTFYVEAINGTCPSSVRTAVVATVIYPEIDIRGNATSIADSDTTPSTTDWTDFGSTNFTRTFTIHNTGSGILNLGTVSITGVNAADFTLITAPNNTVFSGSSTTFIVGFNPSGIGTRVASISIPTNDTDESPYDFSIQGTGIDREIDIQGNAVTIVDGDTTPTTADWTDFSTVTATRTFTIRNTGNITLTLGAITISGTNASDFVVTTPPATTIGAFGSTTFVVTFTPSAILNRVATISIANNDNDENPYNFAIQGYGIIPEIDVQGNATSIADGDTTPTTGDWTDFSNSTITRTYTIYNNGNTLLSIGTIAFSGANATEFTVTTPPASSVAAFGNTSFVVTFAPTAIGTRTATMTIPNNDSNENPYDFTIQGTGVAQEIDIQGNATSIADGDNSPAISDWTDFSNVALTRTFTIRNFGNLPLTVGIPTITGTQASEFAITSNPVSPVPAFGSTTFTVSFTQAGTGNRNAIINLVNNDSNENPYDFYIRATGGAPEINIRSQYGVDIADGDTTPSTGDQTNFGEVSMDGGTVTVNFIIQNTGTGAMSIGAYSFMGANASDFTVTTPPATTIAAGSSSRFKISFSPTTIGVKNATFSIANNDSNENPYDFALSGTGVQTYKDTDGDGVTDNKDVDDDNDGIIDIKEQTDGLAYPLTSLVQYTFLNETFGAGTTKGLININTPGATCTYCYEDGYGSACDASVTLEDGEYVVTYKITGSTASDPENIHGDLAWYDGLDHTPSDTNGRMAVFNASFAAGTFYETRIDGVIPNVPISYSFWVLNIMRSSNFTGSILPNITVEFVDLSNNLISSFNTGAIGRCTTASSSDNSCGASNWLQFSTSVNLGNVTSFIVRFKNNSTGGGGNDLAIDDINITQNYIDTDGDGIANIFDLDDENDGISDVEEAGFKAYSNGLSKMDLSSSTTWADANNNGLHDAIDAQIAGGTYLITDTDGDGVPNYLDLDSDNDSFFDVDEAGMYNGDGDINGDGRGDLADTDKDGILDLYDNNTGFGTATRAYAQDTDANGIADYLQLDSNNDGTNDIQMGLYGNLDANNDGKIDGATDIDKDGITDTFDTNTSVIGSPRDLNRKLFLEFDGRNDYGQDSAVLGGLSSATLMAWIDLNSAFTTEGVIIGQEKFQLRVNSSKALEAVVNTTIVTAPTALSTSQWTHAAVVYTGAVVKLYVNGVLVKTTSLSGTIPTDPTLLTMGKQPGASAKFFKGKIDEVRVFNTALTDAQVQRMVYQEIKNNSSQVRGEIVPKDVTALPYANLLRYYRMDAYKDDIVDNYTTITIDSGTGMKIYNNKVINVQQAPMPFVTERAGDFASAVDNPLKDIRGLDIMDQNWSIVQVKHNITETANNTDLAMFVDPGVTITMNNDTKIQNDWYLKLDGKIDLVDRSQLVQTTESDLDVTSAGSIERDQKGQSNKFNYNYWSSPVGGLSTSSNNNAFTVAGVMKDGTNPANIQNIQWTTGYDSAPTSPITLSSYWIYKFQNLTPVYANWGSVGPNGTLQAAQGYTLKGSNATTPNQNYTFVGKPNSGAISNPIAANNVNLSGNPYPSAIDSNMFITVNSGSTTGAIYFWEHFPTNTSHNLIQYQGGYAVRTNVGGTPPVAPAGISGMGTSTRTPKRFIPVGQGFLVYGSSTGGNIVFNNSMRAFVKEDGIDSNELFKGNTAAGPIDPRFDNREDDFTEDEYAKIRLGFNSSNGFHRQVLLGFMEENATSGFDAGYDAIQMDNQPNEMSFVSNGSKLVIQGDGYFNVNNSYQLGVKTAAAGTISFTLDGTENFDESQEIYIYDNATQEYHDIREGNFEINMPAGSVDDRFSLRFKNTTALATNNFTLTDQVIVRFTNSDDTININNKTLDVNVQSVSLFNMLGQNVNEWDVKHETQNKIQIPVRNVSTGTYIVKVHTTKGDISKKIIIK